MSSREIGHGGDLSARGLTVQLGRFEAVTDVDLDVCEGTISGLIGPNGAGKTTVIDALSGLVPTARGHVTLGARSLDGLPAHARARQGLARTFQSLELFEDLSVGENLLVAAEGAGRGAAWYSGEAVPGAATSLLPSQLSDAQRRLVALTRAVAGGPSVLLLDEPAAALDDAGRQALARRLRELRDGGLGLLVVDHDLDLLFDLCDEVSVLDRGKVVAKGPPEALRQDSKVRAAYLGGDLTPIESPEAGEAGIRGEGGIRSEPPTVPVFEASGIVASYGGTEVVHGVDVHVSAGEVVALLGRNGAGKSTTVRAVAGIMPRTAGHVRLAGTRIPAAKPHRAARRGLACVPQDRSLASQLTVAENLRLGIRGGRREAAGELDRAVGRFAMLGPLRGRRAGLLSGGEQRVVAIARALALRPRVLLLDEPDQGLAPSARAELAAAIQEACEQEGAGILVVGEGPSPSIRLASRAYVMDRGRVLREESPPRISTHD